MSNITEHLLAAQLGDLLLDNVKLRALVSALRSENDVLKRELSAVTPSENQVKTDNADQAVIKDAKS